MMNAEYPPLPRSKELEGAFGSLSLSAGSDEVLSKPDRRRGDYTRADGPALSARVISSSGDVAVEYMDYRWQVQSSDLVRNSPYFRALLDPNKFAEGQRFMRQKRTLGRVSCSGEMLDSNTEINVDEESTPHELLPTVSLQVNGFKRKTLGLDIVELFLKMLSLSSFREEEKQRFYGELKSQPPSVVSRLIEVADMFNSLAALKTALQECGYSFFGKGKISLTRFSPALLKISEDRIRHVIFIAMFLEDRAIFQVFTHALIVLGSRLWINGVAQSDPESPPWRHFQNGLEGTSVVDCMVAWRD